MEKEDENWKATAKRLGEAVKLENLEECNHEWETYRCDCPDCPIGQEHTECSLCGEEKD